MHNEIESVVTGDVGVALRLSLPSPQSRHALGFPLLRPHLFFSHPYHLGDIY